MPRILHATLATLTDVITALKADGHAEDEVLNTVNTLVTFGDADLTLLSTHKVIEAFGIGSGSAAGRLLAGVEYVDFEH